MCADPFACTGLGPLNNTYKALRVIGQRYSLLYTVWCTGEMEYYDLHVSISISFWSISANTAQRDPFQMQNLLDRDYESLSENYTLAHRPFKHLITRLDALLMVLKSCKAETCRKPWTVLHPDGSARNLKEALSAKYDAFYERQSKVAFNSCVMGHIVEEEGPQDVHVWHEDEWAMGPVGREQQILGGGPA